MSGCDFREAVFSGGSLRNAHTKLTRFDGADLRETDIAGLKVLDAKLFKNALISPAPGGGLVKSLGTDRGLIGPPVKRPPAGGSFMGALA